MEPRSPRKRRRIILLSIAGLVVVLVAAAAWVGIRGLLAKEELDEVVARAGQAAMLVVDGEMTEGRVQIQSAAEHAEAAASLTGDPVWRALEIVPWAGPNLHAVRMASTHTHQLLANAALPVVDLADALESEGDGLIDLEALRAASPTLNTAAQLAAQARADLTSIDPDRLLPPIADGVSTLADAADELAPLVAGIADASNLLPTMLGADGPRSILLMVQNNAELRTGGGITGTFLELRAEGGAITVVTQADSSDFERTDTAIIDVPESTTTLYSNAFGEWVQNASMSADFDVTARLASAWWQQRSGAAPDAVVSVDPLVLRAVLATQGEMDTAAGTLNADNLVDTLLLTPYLTMSREEQTLLFQAVSLQVFESVTSGQISLQALVSALIDPLAEGRISVWSAHDDEASLLAATTLAGPAARQAQAGDDAFAVYFNDTTGGKMDNYLEVAIGTVAAQCATEGRSDVEVAVTLTSTAPSDAADLPWVLTGGGILGVAPGDISTIVTVSAPVGSFYGAVTVDGEPVAPTTLEDAGFPVSATTVVLHPGESKTAVFRFVSAEGVIDQPTILHTPLLSAPELTSLEPVCG